MVLELKMDYQKAKNQYADAMGTGLEVMDLLGKRMPKPIIPVLLVAILRTRWRLYRFGIEKLVDHRPCYDPMAEASERIALNLGNVTYVAKPEYNPLLTQHLIKGVLRNGLTEYSPFSIISFGLVIIAALNDLHYGKRLAEVGLKVMARLKPGRWEGRTRFMYNTFIAQWFEPLRDVGKYQEESYHLSVQSGDFEFASFAILTGIFQQFIAGQPLTALKERALLYQKVHRDTLGIPAKYDEFITIHLQPSLLTGDMEGLERWDGTPYDFDQLEADFKENKNELSLAGLYWTYMTVGLILNKVDEAWKHCELHGEIGYSEATVGWGQHMLFRCLIMMRRWDAYTTTEKRKNKRYLTQTIGRFKKWSKINSRNFHHKYCFLLAERARLLGKTSKALEHYHEALVSVAELQILHEMGMLHERVASLHQEMGQTGAAQMHLREAHRVYQRWQSPVKLEEMEAAHPELLNQAGTTLTQTQTSSGSTPNLDLMSFIKSSQAISGELKLQQLLEKMLEVVMENSGAQRGLLLLYQQQQLLVEGTIDYRDQSRQFGQSKPLAEHGDLAPTSLVYYVGRSGKEAALSDPHEL
ncbi:MAG: hypothetical protein AAFQ98_13625, partial [Bacteroidota bacterium]